MSVNWSEVGIGGGVLLLVLKWIIVPLFNGGQKQQEDSLALLREQQTKMFGLVMELAGNGNDREGEVARLRREMSTLKEDVRVINTAVVDVVSNIKKNHDEVTARLDAVGAEFDSINERCERRHPDGGA